MAKKYNLALDDLPSPQTIDGVFETLRALNAMLAKSDIPLLKNFNQAYFVITKNVRQQLRSHVFEYPDFLEQFDICFASYYLEALQSYCNGENVPVAWYVLFEGCRKQSLSPLKAMALGVNAHINNDIPQALADTLALEDHYRDYVRINNIIHSSIYETIENLDLSYSALDPKHKVLKPIYRLGMHIIVRLWRGSAWRKFQRLQKRQIEVNDIERQASFISKGTNFLPV